MRTCLALLVLACLSAEAHIGSPNVFFEGKAGEYFVRAVIRPPQVVPGLAEINVRVPGGPVERVTVLPVFSRAGREVAVFLFLGMGKDHLARGAVAQAHLLLRRRAGDAQHSA